MTERVRKAIEDGAGAVGDRMAAAGDRVSDAARAVGEARDAVGDKASEAAAAVGEVAARVKPRLRGVSHFWAFFVALVAGGVLVATAPDGRATLAAAIYAGSLAALFGISALYHRIDWRPTARRWMRRLDHSAIFVLIAGTVTPFALLVLEGPLATALLVAVWAGAVAGIVVELFWFDAPKWVTAIVYLSVGWIGALGYPAIIAEAGIAAGALIAIGGVLYTAGAVVYARQRPDPNPAVFGYHEIFHALVIAAAAAHFAAVAIFALPAA